MYNEVQGKTPSLKKNMYYNIIKNTYHLALDYKKQ